MKRHNPATTWKLWLAMRTGLAFGLGLGAFLLLLGFVRALQAPEALPNLRILYVGSLDFEQPFVVGRPNTISLVVWNSDAISAENVFVRVYSGAPEFGGTPLGDSLPITQVLGASSRETAFAITPTHAGTHTLHLRVDPDNTIAESNESDNAYSHSIAVREVQPEWYVNASVTSSGDGRTAETAFKTIVEALQVAAAGESVLVAAGVYSGSLNIKAGVSLKGAGMTNTLIDETGALLRGVALGSNSSIEGFTIANNGKPTSGSGIYLQGSATAKNNFVRGYTYGINVTCFGEKPCDGAALVTNNVLALNEEAGLIISGRQLAQLRNNTIYSSEWGIQVFNNLGHLIENNIILASAVAPVYAPTTTTVQFNLIFANDQATCPTWPGTICQDPLLRNPAQSDFRLVAGSPARKRGHPAPTDLGALPFVPVGMPPIGLAVQQTSDLRWLVSWANDGAAGYYLHIGTRTGQYDQRIHIGAITSHTLRNLLGAVTYFFAISAHNLQGDESELSPEVILAVPPLPNRLYQDDDIALSFLGEWTRVGDDRAMGGSFMQATAVTSSLAFAFSGDRVVIYRSLAPDGGSSEVYVDDEWVGRLSFNLPITRWQVPAILDQFGSGVHRLQIQPTTWPTKGPIRIDAIEMPGVFNPTVHQLRAVERVNIYRERVNFPLAIGMSSIHLGAQAHAEFVANNAKDPRVAGLGFHQQHPDLPGFVGQWPSHRAQYFGYMGGVGEDGHFIGDAVGSVDGWMETVYHRNLILCYGCIEMGYGRVNDGRGRFDVLNMGSRAYPAPPSRLAAVYPADGQLNVPTTWFGAEIPDPLPGKARPVGYPISLHIAQANPDASSATLTSFQQPPWDENLPFLPSMRSTQATSWTLTTAELRNSANELVPAYVLDVYSDAPKYLGPDNAFIIAKSPLKKDETYVVRFAGIDSRGKPFDARATFATGGNLVAARPTASFISINPSLPRAGETIHIQTRITNTNLIAKNVIARVGMSPHTTLVTNSVQVSSGSVSSIDPLTLAFGNIGPNHAVTMSFDVTLSTAVITPTHIALTMDVLWDFGSTLSSVSFIANGKAVFLSMILK